MPSLENAPLLHRARSLSPNFDTPSGSEHLDDGDDVRETAALASPSAHRHDMEVVWEAKHPPIASKAMGMTFTIFALLLVLIASLVQIELNEYLQNAMGWRKPYCLMYLTHSSWLLTWMAQVALLRFQQKSVPFRLFWRQHVDLIRNITSTLGQADSEDDSPPKRPRRLPYLFLMSFFLTILTTMSAAPWYLAFTLTTPSDLVAIYNCGAIFAYVFGVPLLKERFRWDSSAAVIIAVVGVFVISYGNAQPADQAGEPGQGSNRLLGNVVVGVGAVLLGLYNVLYKKLVCPPRTTAPRNTLIFANTTLALLAAFTLGICWIPILILHVTGLETFQLPTGRAAGLLIASILSSDVSMSAFHLLLSLTTPVFSSVTAIFGIILIAAADSVISGKPPSVATFVGGAMIILAFAVLSWATFDELGESSHGSDGRSLHFSGSGAPSPERGDRDS